ncbi:MAG TPA: hypothetical protein VMT79_03525 [Candidatus Binatia bacterium]|nr:hypothetical protein [Candidatus Binatia bacterium]
MGFPGPQAGRALRQGLLAGLGLGAAALASSGCVSAGLAAAGPLATAIYAVADRSVERTLPADQVAAWDATVETFRRMALRVEGAEQSGESWVLRGTGEKVSVEATLAPVTARMTSLGLRVEAGRLTADKKTADEILNQVAASLAAATAAARPRETAPAAADPRAAEALSSLRQEVERLGARMDRAPAPERAPGTAGATASPAVLEAGAIVVVPTSVGVPSVEPLPGSALAGGFAGPTLAAPIAAGSLRDGRASDDVASPQGNGIGGWEPVRVGVETDLLVPALAPAGVLAPVEGVPERRGGP